MRRFLRQLFGAEEARIDDHRLYAERGNLDLQRFHPAVDSKF